MKELSFLLIFFLFPTIIFASWDYSKEKACKLKDGVYTKNLQVNYPWYITNVRNFIKSGKLFYVVNAYDSKKDQTINELYSYDCKSKKAKLLKDITLLIGNENAEIDYFNTDYIFIRYLSEGIESEFPSNEGVFSRKNNSFNEFNFSNQDELISQYVQDFWEITDIPYTIVDITTGQDKKLLAWITWWDLGSSMLRALSVDPITFRASNVTYDYMFKNQDNSYGGWLKLQGWKIYEKSNDGAWHKIEKVDVKTFRAIQWNYGRDKNGYTQLNANINLPNDSISTGYHIWYSQSQGKIYTFHLWDWTITDIEDPSTIYFHDSISFDDPQNECVNTTDSYGYLAEDDKVCYGDIGWSHSSFGIVGKRK